MIRVQLLTSTWCLFHVRKHRLRCRDIGVSCRPVPMGLSFLCRSSGALEEARAELQRAQAAAAEKESKVQYMQVCIYVDIDIRMDL